MKKAPMTLPPRIEILLEEESAQMLVNGLSSKIFEDPEIEIEFHKLSIKPLRPESRKRLEDRLRAYNGMIQNGIPVGVVILIDEDREDCKALKQELERITQNVGLRTKTNPRGSKFHVVNRIVVEELEAWHFGDPSALKKAYPNLKFATLRKYARDPDGIPGGTWEKLEKLFKKARYSSFSKTEVAEKVSQYMRVDDGHNSSPSFQAFICGMRALANQLRAP